MIGPRQVGVAVALVALLSLAGAVFWLGRPRPLGVAPVTTTGVEPRSAEKPVEGAALSPPPAVRSTGTPPGTTHAGRPRTRAAHRAGPERSPSATWRSAGAATGGGRPACSGRRAERRRIASVRRSPVSGPAGRGGGRSVGAHFRRRPRRAHGRGGHRRAGRSPRRRRTDPQRANLRSRPRRRVRPFRPRATAAAAGLARGGSADDRPGWDPGSLARQRHGGGERSSRAAARRADLARQADGGALPARRLGSRDGCCRDRHPRRPVAFGSGVADPARLDGPAECAGACLPQCASSSFAAACDGQRPSAVRPNEPARARTREGVTRFAAQPGEGRQRGGGGGGSAVRVRPGRPRLDRAALPERDPDRPGRRRPGRARVLRDRPRRQGRRLPGAPRRCRSRLGGGQVPRRGRLQHAAVARRDRARADRVEPAAGRDAAADVRRSRVRTASGPTSRRASASGSGAAFGSSPAGRLGALASACDAAKLPCDLPAHSSR